MSYDVERLLTRPVMFLALWNVSVFFFVSLIPFEKPLSRSVRVSTCGVLVAKTFRIFCVIVSNFCILQGDYNLAVSDYKKVKALFSTSDCGAFERGGLVFQFVTVSQG